VVIESLAAILNMNPFNQHITLLARDLTQLNGQAIHFAYHLHHFSKELEEKSPQDQFLANRLTFHDPTGNDSGLFLPDDYYLVDKSNIKELSEIIIEIERNFIISQVFEKLVSFLKNTICQIIENNFQFGIKCKIIVDSNLKPTKETIKKAVDEFVKLKKTRKLLWVLRKYSQDYAIYEKLSLFPFPYNHWFDTVAETRNIIIHSGAVVTNTSKLIHDTLSNSIILRYFKFKLIEEPFYMLILTENQLNDFISDVVGFGFLVYRCVSLEIGDPFDAIKQ
jgi:hypothetical protein